MGAAIVTPWVSSEAMTIHLAEIAKQVDAGAHAVLVCDGAAIPANVGVNPSLTITAMAEHAMTHVPDRGSRTDGVWV